MVCGRFLQLLCMFGMLVFAAATCSIHQGGTRRLALEQANSNDDYGRLDFSGEALPDSVLPTQMYVDSAYATVDPSDLLHIDVIIAESIGAHDQKQAIAESLPEILKEVINSNWVVEVRSMSDLEATPFANVSKYEDTFSYQDILKQAVEKFSPALSRRNVADRSIRVPVYFLISDSELQNDVRQKLDDYIAKDPRRRVFALVEEGVADSFLSWRDSDNGKEMVDYSVDLKIEDLNVVMRELSGHIADTLRSNFHLHGFCDLGIRHTYQRDPLTLAVEMKFHGGDASYLSANSYYLLKDDSAVFIKGNLNDNVCVEASYVYETTPDDQQTCRSAK